MNLLKGLNKPILGLDGQTLKEPGGKPITPGALLGNSLARGKSSEPARAVALAIKIYEAGNTLELDHNDLNLVKRGVTDDNMLNNLALNAINKVFDEAETKESEEKK